MKNKYQTLDGERYRFIKGRPRHGPYQRKIYEEDLRYVAGRNKRPSVWWSSKKLGDFKSHIRTNWPKRKRSWKW